MDISRLKYDLKRDEGLRLNIYKDSVGILTIGCGRNIEQRGITAHEAEVLLTTDIYIAVEELERNIPGYKDLPEPVQRGLANMVFNMGWPRLSSFKKCWQP